MRGGDLTHVWLHFRTTVFIFYFFVLPQPSVVNIMFSSLTIWTVFIKKKSGILHKVRLKFCILKEKNINKKRLGLMDSCVFPFLEP